MNWAFFVFASQALGEALVVTVAAWFDHTIINVDGFSFESLFFQLGQNVFYAA